MSEGNCSSSQSSGQPAGFPEPVQGAGVRSSVVMKKLVVKNRRCQFMSVFDILNRIFAPNQPALTEHIAITLARDLLRHLEDQFNERVRRQLVGSFEKDSGLADVLNQTFVPGAEIFSPVP